MITVEITNSRAFIAGLQNASREVQRGASEGIKKTVDDLAHSVATNTRVKTGKARNAVYGRMRSSLEGEVGYAKEVRWYMRIVELSGSRPHVIIAKALKGRLSGVTKGQLTTALRLARSSNLSDRGFAGDARSFRRNVSTFDSTRKSGRTTSKQRLYESLKAAGVDQGRLKEFRAGLKLGARALAFQSKGTLIVRGAVLHPGIKSSLVLRTQLAGARGSIVANVDAGIRARLASRGSA